MTKSQKYHAAKKNAGICVRCENKSEDRAVYCVECREVNRLKTLKWRANLKEDILDAYGRKCACCGETEIDFLVLDHVNGDGAAHRRSSGGFYYARIEIRKQGFPDCYQLLCANCNMSKGITPGTRCPTHLRHSQGMLDGGALI